MRTGVSIYRFNGFVLDLVRGSLFSVGGGQVRLRARSFSMLRLFVENAGSLLDHHTISQAIWPDVTVTDESIAQCVSDIRRALGEQARGALKTIPRRGYVFDAEVTSADGSQPQLRSWPRTSAGH
jgi:DNA-binding winged helix-turn-helix (wHTH) protein